MKTGACADNRECQIDKPHKNRYTFSKAGVSEWQTMQTQNLLPPGRVGSSPTAGIYNAQHHFYRTLSVFDLPRAEKGLTARYYEREEKEKESGELFPAYDQQYHQTEQQTG